MIGETMAYKRPGYIGPDEVWRRFMAGFKVTHLNALEDESKWVTRPMTRYDADRLAAMIAADR